MTTKTKKKVKPVYDKHGNVVGLMNVSITDEQLKASILEAQQELAELGRKLEAASGPEHRHVLEFEMECSAAKLMASEMELLARQAM